MAKLRGPNVTVWEFGTHRSPFAAERRCRHFLYPTLPRDCQRRVLPHLQHCVCVYRGLLYGPVVGTADFNKNFTIQLYSIIIWLSISYRAYSLWSLTVRRFERTRHRFASRVRMDKFTVHLRLKPSSHLLIRFHSTQPDWPPRMTRRD